MLPIIELNEGLSSPFVFGLQMSVSMTMSRFTLFTRGWCKPLRPSTGFSGSGSWFGLDAGW